jgi:hypothetical protein
MDDYQSTYFAKLKKKPCTPMTIHPQKELTKFGYKSKRKIEKKNPSTI